MEQAKQQIRDMIDNYNAYLENSKLSEEQYQQLDGRVVGLFMALDAINGRSAEELLKDNNAW